MSNVVDVAFNLLGVQGRIDKAMHDAERKADICLVAVSKWHTADSIAKLAALGHKCFGESYVQEALEKQEKLRGHPLLRECEWHFVGHIQSRKAKDVVGRFSLIHTVDTEKLALLLQKFAAEKNIHQNILIQVNIGNEPQKSGVKIKDLLPLAMRIMECKNLQLQGLMCLPPVFDAGDEARPYFALLRRLRETLQNELHIHLPHLSMGMSGDLEAAIMEGSTMVRVGTDIFGPRP